MIPAYDEAEGIVEALSEVRSAILDRVPGAVALFVDDGSRDRTPELLAEAARQDPRISVLRIEHSGHGPALVAGFDAASGERILHVDSDLEVDLGRFGECWAAARDHDLVLGERVGRDSPLLRRLVALGLEISLRLLFGIRVRDAASPFKIFRRQVWEEFRSLGRASPCIPSLFVAVHALATGRPVRVIGLVHRERRTGRSWLAGTALARASWRSLGDLFAYRRALSTRERRTG